jgi:hypothetical protein
VVSSSRPFNSQRPCHRAYQTQVDFKSQQQLSIVEM